ncbi:MAG: beta-ketoacyl-ACP synthase III [Candidatus Didemnitutus sp.]|nr:beta-ketoacyl-ACP synthase III [Candidatus Didemnitutus sp.]
MASVIIAGVGAYAPERVLTNQDLAKMVDTSDEWIFSRSGIRERHIAADDEACSDLAIKSAMAALKDANMSAAEVDLLIVATATPDYTLPATACVVQHKLGVPPHATCFDIAAACSGFVYALEIAYGQLLTGRYKCALIIGAEKLSTIVDWSDRTTCVLFGDGAGSAVLKKVEQSGIGIIGSDLGADGELTEYLYTPAGGSRCPASAKTVADKGHFLKMKGKEIFKNAVRVMETVAREMVEQHNLRLDQIDLVIPHQANVRIVEALASNLGLPMDRFFMNIDRFGNTSSASIPIALDEARRSGRIKPGDLTLLVAFGAGFTYGSTLIRW